MSGNLLLALAVASTIAQSADAQSPSPSGTTWDAIVSGGSHRGIAFMWFEPNGTLNGYQLLAPKPLKKSDNDMRAPYGDVGRSGEPTGTNGTSSVKLYGFGDLQAGTWGYDSRGRLVGDFSVLVNEGTDKELVPYRFSFTGKFVPNKRLNLVAYTPVGKLTFSAKPYRPTPGLDLTGNWYSVKKTDGQIFSEVLPLYRQGYEEGLYYTEKTVYYTSDSEGPGYTISGAVLLSSQKKIGFAIQSWATGAESPDVTSYATFGSFSSRKGILKASTKRVQEPYQSVLLNAEWQSPLPEEGLTPK